MAGLLPEREVQIKAIKKIGWSQETIKINFASRISALIFMWHVNDVDRTPDIAFCWRTDSGYCGIYNVCKTNTGKGIYLSDSTESIIVDGISSPKLISIIILSGNPSDITYGDA